MSRHIPTLAKDGFERVKGSTSKVQETVFSTKRRIGG